MKKRLRVAILFGGKSAEHEISILSAKNIVEAMNQRKYEPVLIGIDKKGRWFLDKNARLLRGQKFGEVQLDGEPLGVIPGANGAPFASFTRRGVVGAVDVVFPVLHGPFGEDGTVQGLLKLAHVPFVGAGVLGSAVGMDKDVMKRLLRDAGIPIADFFAFERRALGKINFNRIRRSLGLPLFIKPANLGSSVGISKVNNRKQFDRAIREAFWFDGKILIEEFIRGREIECAVLGNQDPIASLPGEVISHHEFYSYEAKYIDQRGAALAVPAKLPARVIRKIRELSCRTFQLLDCHGMARVDFFVSRNGKVFVNEINTIPGFTKISMYPKMWEASGVSYPKLIDKLIQLALEKFRRERALKTSVARR